MMNDLLVYCMTSSMHLGIMAGSQQAKVNLCIIMIILFIMNII